jgi:hypothetical protein
MSIAAFFRKRYKKHLTESGPPPTFVRLLTSQHLAELQSIAFWTLLILLLISLWFIIILVKDIIWGPRDLITNELTVTGGVFAVAATVLSWTYQTGNKRLGAIDLFASEISAICRMSLIADFALAQVHIAEREHEGLIQGAQGESSIKFTSEEHYTPVYDRNLSDLEPLNVTTISNVTEFYSYRKAMIDYLRRIAVESDDQSRRTERNMMIYMQFLMYESARYAVAELIEFEPNLEESKINILCSELVVFNYLMKVFTCDDYRGKRLRIRNYEMIVLDTLNKVNKGQGQNWLRARTTATQLLYRARKYKFLLNNEFE